MKHIIKILLQPTFRCLLPLPTATSHCLLHTVASYHRRLPLPTATAYCRFLLLLTSIFFLTLPAFSQLLPLKPPIRNYPPKEYAAHNQIWCAAKDHRGVLYFGVGENVLEYDGKTWRLIPVKPGAFVYSLATDSTGRIYVGTEVDFGYISYQASVGSSKLQRELDSLKIVEDTLPKGTLCYVSLLHLVPENERNFGQVWKTHSCKKGTFFNAYTHLFHYDGKRITVIKPEELMGADTVGTKPQNRRFFNSFLIDDILYIEHNAMGILQYTEKKCLPLARSKEFVRDAKGIYALLPANKQKSEFFVITKHDGLWHYSTSAKPEFTQFIAGTQSGVQRGGKIVNSTWDIYNPQCQPYGAILLQTMGQGTIADAYIAINTNYNGCYIFSPPVINNGFGNSLALQHHFNRESGTLDNTIINILSTDNDRWAHNTSLLWLCNNNGISKVTYTSPLSYYGYKEGIEGIIQSIITWKNRLWLATMQGVYYSLNPVLPQERMKTDKGLFFERLPGIDTQCWNILPYRKTGAVKGEMEEVLIISASYSGLYEISVSAGGEIKTKQLSKDKSYRVTAEDIPGGRIFSGDDGLYATWQEKESWTTTTLLTEKEVKGIISITLSEKKTTLGEKGKEETELWLGTSYQGLLRVVVTADNKVKETEWYGEEDGLPEGIIQTFSCTGAAGSNGVVVGTDKGLFEISNFKSQIPNKKLQIMSCGRYGNMFAGKLKSDSGSYRQVFLFVGSGEGDVWMVTSDREYHLRKTNDNIYKIDSIPFLNIRNKIGAPYAIHPSGEGITFLGGAEGLAMYDGKVKKNYKPVYSALVRKVMVGEDSVIYNGFQVPGSGFPVLPYNLNNTSFEFAAPFFEEEEKTEYSYNLKGFDKDWSKWSTDAKTKYTNLEQGKYRFLVRAKNIYSHESEVGEYFFEIKPPWWHTWWAYLSYMVIGLLFIWGIVWLNGRRLIADKKKLEKKVKLRTQQLEEQKKQVEKERDKSDKLLLNILPEETAKELKEKGIATPHFYELATVMFTDFKGFTKLAEYFSEHLLLDELNFCFIGYDRIMKKYGVEKIKTIGDSYMCVSGVPVRDEQHAIKMVLAALDIQEFMKNYIQQRIKENKLYFECRLGIHSGPVVAGVVGESKFAFDIWGDTVNVASRMESNGEPGKVNISESTYLLVKDHFIFSEPREVIAKNKGIVKAYFVVGRKE